jgi:WD40 repeat protein
MRYFQLFISDLNNVANPFRLGHTAARTDDIDCLDWNKKVAHIMVTGTSAGFVTVWDVKTKKESLTLNNLGRKAVSAVAWDPDKVRDQPILRLSSLTSNSLQNLLHRHPSSPIP